MKLTVTGRHMDVPGAARQAIDKKLARLERVLHDNAISAQCVFWEERGAIVCELTVHARHDHRLHAIARDAQLIRAVSMAVEKVSQQAQRLKDRWTTHRRTENGAAKGASSARASGDDTGAPPRGGGGRVVRFRRTAAKPMSLDDAVLEFSASDSHVMVFRDATSEGVSVLCRRADGNFWLIEPEA